MAGGSPGNIAETTLFPTSFIQQQFWLTQALYPQSSASNIPCGFRLKGNLDVSALRKSLNELIERHAVLRTSFLLQGGKLFQALAPNVPFEIQIEDMVDAVASADVIRKVMDEETFRPFDLTRAPLLRVKLLRFAPDDHILLLTMHHIVADLETRKLFTSALSLLYGACVSGDPSSIPSPEHPYVDYALWQHEWLKSDAAAKMLAYWKQLLEACPAPMSLPPDGERLPPPDINGAEMALDLSSGSLERLELFSRNEKVNLFTTLLAAYGVVLYKYSGQKDTVIGVPLTNRKRTEDQETFGVYANILPLRLSLAGDPSFCEVVRQVRVLLLKAHRNQEIPFEVILREVRPSRGDDFNPLFRVGFTFEPEVDLSLEGLTVEPVAVRRGSPPQDIFVSWKEQNGGICGLIEYNSDLFRETTIQDFFANYLAVIESLLAAPQQPVSKIPLVCPPTKERTGRIAIASTFAAEPLEGPLAFWTREIGMPFGVEISSYNQVFQQLLDPEGIFLRGNDGVNIVLIRFEDWLSDESRHSDSSAGDRDDSERLERASDELTRALRSAVKESSLPILVFLCPASSATLQDANRISLFRNLEERLASEIHEILGAHFVHPSKFETLYPVSEYDEALLTDRSAIPYTPESFVSFATAIVRSVRGLLSEPHKVVVLDCDGTLWKGVVGEDGAAGVQIDPPYVALQNHMVSLHDAGMLVCLCSKNNADDVFEVFSSRQEMPLKKEHLASSRINWESKSENLRSMAKEMNLGLDSFIFLDDNPIECAEVRSNCPEVMVLELPQNPEDIPRFLEHVWVFDRWNVTTEDKKRTRSYHEQKNRETLREESLTFQEFLAGLELEVDISPITVSQITRASQLTLRTNQFNTTTVRRSENDIQALLDLPDRDILVAKARDRFGDYGIVGLIGFQTMDETLRANTFLLSCRAMGKGVEHQMLAALGKIALERQKQQLEVLFRPSEKNQPALTFLEKVGGQLQEKEGDESRFHFSASRAAEIVFAPEERKPSDADKQQGEKDGSATPTRSATTEVWPNSQLIQRIATDLSHPDQILELIHSLESKARKAVTRRIAPHVPPRTDTERAFVAAWQKVLRLEKVGVEDNFFDLGGHSILIPQIINILHTTYSLSMSMIDMFQYPTIAAIAAMKDHNPAEPPSAEDFQDRAQKRRAALRRRKRRPQNS